MTYRIQTFDELELLRFLFERPDKLNIEECKTHINDLLVSLQSTLKYESTINEYSLVKLYVLKTFLKLHNEFLNDSVHEMSELSTKPVFNLIKELLNKNSNDDDQLNNAFHQHVLQIISLLFKIALEQSTKEDVCSALEFSEFNLSNIKSLEQSENFSSKNFFLGIKILSTIFDSLSNILKYKPIKDISSFYLSSEKYICELFAKVVLNAENKLAVHVLLFSIPLYTNLCETYAPIIRIWKNVSETIWESDEKCDRILIVMCYLLNFCFDHSKLESKKDVIVSFFEDQNFWRLIQFGLIGRNPIMKKQAMYLFKKSILILGNCDINVVSWNKATTDVDVLKREIFFWDFNKKNALENIFNEIIIILEFLDEQQTHLIKPIFQMVEKLVGKISAMPNSIDFSWIILIYEKSLMHESTQVIKWGLTNMLKLPDQFFSDMHMIEKIAKILVPALNNTSIYYNDSSVLSKDLTKFLIKITNLKTAKKFFTIFLRELCTLTWSPEALYFVTFSTSVMSNFVSSQSQIFHWYWGRDEIFELKNFVSKVFKTHNKIIRNGVQCHLLNTIIKLTDTSDVPLKSMLLLLSVFFNLKTLHIGNEMWFLTVNWLKNSYSVQEAEKVIEEFKKKSLGPEFNEKSSAFMLMLFYDVYSCKNIHGSNLNSNCFITNILLQMLQSFKDIPKRLYCDKSLCDYYLLIICCIMEETELTEEPTLLTIFSPFLNDILTYIQSQVKLLVNLEDFDNCEFYVRTFKEIVKIQELHKNDLPIDFRGFYMKVLQDLELNLCSDSDMPSLVIYCQIKLLKIMIESSLYKELIKSCFINSYLLNKVNEPLKREERYLEKPKNIQMLWGKMNSNFLEAKWQMLEHSFRDLTFEVENSMCTVFKLCEEALNIGGYGVLCPVMSILKKLIPKGKDVSYIKEIIHRIWRTVMERRKTEEFKLLIKKFGEMVFQESLLSKEKHLCDIFDEYIDLIFSDSNLAVVNIFIKHIQQIPITNDSVDILCEIVARGLIYGPVQKKDERLTAEICSHIETSKICSVGDYHTSNEVRARCVQIILKLKVDDLTHRTFAKSLIKTLIKMENDLNKNKVRYFGDSHVHRVKHRLLQSLLLLEPLLQPYEKESEELLEWLYNSLMAENSQPSVKYQQEWLLVRMLLRRDDSLNRFWNYFCDCSEKKTKGVCSLIAIAYHLCKLVPIHVTSRWIDQAVSTLLPLCMAQHFELRLYAQVVLEKIYNLAKDRGLSEVIKKYEMIYKCILKSIENGCKGNTGKNCIKLQEDFYLNVFHPLEHYSLETIYVELPRLANVGCDEWISSKVFSFCGVQSDQVNILVENTNKQLGKTKSAKWVVDKASAGVHYESGEENMEEPGENYQKKMIPLKPLIPEWDEALNPNDNRRSTSKKDGLVVVASLIDKIPNLGGLVRTCEIFGASEYVINSLKYLEDKQFTSLSVTAEKWVTVKEVKLQNLLYYILEMKDMGYTVVGAEQALHSQPLSSVKFPKKTLLLLGNEKTGIPPNILPLLDVCVEIPQVGVIRSLNVHVTGALFIWEYAKQNHFT